ncbi:hypothetical protein MCOR25_002321 [Pyricularia grisea]|nr:hypothetical protein MCOR25_002321 [Pyricularia grisea]
MRRLSRQVSRLPRQATRCFVPNYRLFHNTSPIAAAVAQPLGASDSNSQQPPATPSRPTIAPKPVIDLKHIRQNPALYEQNCVERNYKSQSTYPARINALFEQWHERQREGRTLRERANLLRRQLANPSASLTEAPDPQFQDLTSMSREELLEEGKRLKEQLSSIEDSETRLEDEMHSLGLALPNLTSTSTPRGSEPIVLSYINVENDDPTALLESTGKSDRVWRSHVHIGSELGIMDFAGAATASGWGWYYLLGDGAALEQALVQYALAVATRYGWTQVSPPSIVYSHIAGACGFQPRDQNGETQIYNLAQTASDAERGRPELCLTATAEIPLAGMKADTQLEEAELSMRRVAVSRCYRAEAGARGVDTKGLYRVHEFTKVEMFAWTSPNESETMDIFDEMLDIQTEILGALGLSCRVLEMPSTDLGASATRKNDIEAFFPSRRLLRDDGWGEVTSASICTDYQTRRLATRVRIGGKMTYPWTVNGTALAVPRVLAAILENGWDEDSMTVTIPEVLRPWMDGKEKIGPKHRRR